MKLSITCVDDFLNRTFYKLGLVVGRHPGYFVIVPVLLACICLTGYQRIHYEIDPEYLFSPINGPGKIERSIVESYFKTNYSSLFSVGRITRPGRFGHMIITSKDNDTNILRKKFWDELIILDQIVKNVSVVYEGETFRYDQICAKWRDTCFSNDILDLDLIIDEVEEGKLNLTFPLMFNPVSFTTYMFPVYFGATEVTEDSTIKSVPSVQLGYFLKVDNAHQDAIGAAWEEAFLDAVGEAEDSGRFKYISTSRFASRTMELEFERNTQTVVPYYTSTFLVICVFSVVTCMMADWVRSKPWLGFLGNVSAAMATTSAFGLCMYLGIDFIGINLAAPFLMIGIGIDDTFVVLAAWRRTSITSPVPDRMAKTLSEAAVSITITSLTDMISFFIGIISPFPSVRIFCIYSGFAVVFTFLFHLSFFSGCVAISGYCEQKNLHSVVCCKVQPLSKSRHRSWFYRIFCTGGIDPDDPTNPLDNPEHGCMSFFRDYLAAALNQPIIKGIVIIAFCFYLAGALYGLTTVKEGLDRRRLSKEDSYSIVFYNREDHYFKEYPYRIQVVISGYYDYSDPTIQKQVEDLLSSLENTPYIAESILTESWLRSYIAYDSSFELEDTDEDTTDLAISSSNNSTEIANVTISREKQFITNLKETFLRPGSTFALDVKLDEKEEHIIASRFMIQAVNVSGTTMEKNMVRELRRICEESPLNASVFNPYFVFFDQFELVRPTSIQCMIFGALVMMLISLIFIPNILCSLWVAFCIVSIECGVAGYMALWDVSLDSISMINLIMCIGFSVDFTAHICYAYMSSTKTTPDEKVRDCLYSLGLPIVQGALSTILGLLALLLAGTYIFLVFFKMVFLTIFLGAVHGLLLLPVLLSLFGPCESADKEKPDKKEPEDITKLSQPYVIPHPSLFYHQNKITKGSPTVSLTVFEERDPGLGTSEDSNSTESGSSQSRRKTKSDQEDQQRRYDGWRRSVGVIQSLSQFQPNPPPDYPGADQVQALREPYLGNPMYYASLQHNNKDYRRSRSQHNLNQSASRYFTDPRYP